jgi:hypothetical protein
VFWRIDIEKCKWIDYYIEWHNIEWNRGELKRINKLVKEIVQSEGYSTKPNVIADR